MILRFVGGVIGNGDQVKISGQESTHPKNVVAIELHPNNVVGSHSGADALLQHRVADVLEGMTSIIVFSEE